MELGDMIRKCGERFLQLNKYESENSKNGLWLAWSVEDKWHGVSNGEGGTPEEAVKMLLDKLESKYGK